jgi:hypothetical protein
LKANETAREAGGMTGTYLGNDTFTVTAPDRLERVKNFTAEQCHAALELPNLQKTVRNAIERRLKQLEKPALISRSHLSHPDVAILARAFLALLPLLKHGAVPDYALINDAGIIAEHVLKNREVR